MLHSKFIPNLVGHTIDHGRLRFTETLGSGSNGVIFLAQDTSSSLEKPVEYAVKCIIRAPRGTRRYGLQHQEIYFHSQLSHHPNIVTLHRVIQDEYYIYLVMDYCRGGDLFTFLSNTRAYRGDDEWVRRMLLQILEALQACHSAGIYHRDIKPENILVSEDGSRLLLTDFGLATMNAFSTTFNVGSSPYMSPECLAVDPLRRPYSTAANDIWGLGVVLTSMISGHNPWSIARLTDPCYAAFLENPAFLHDMLPISPASSRLLRRIFRREGFGGGGGGDTSSGSRAGLQRVRDAVLATNTFYMCPADIARGGSFLRATAETYFAESPHENYYVTWAVPHPRATSRTPSPLASIDLTTGSGGPTTDVCDAEAVTHDASRISNVGGCGGAQSASSTLDTDGPETPELRPQQLDVEVQDGSAGGIEGRRYSSTRMFPEPQRPTSSQKRPRSSAPSVTRTAPYSFLQRLKNPFLVKRE